MPVDLQDEHTQPNPILKPLVDIGHELFRLSMESANPIARWQYSQARDNVNLAISCLMEVKNTIAQAQGDE